MEARIKLLRETNKQEDILLSVLPLHIACDVKKDIAGGGRKATMFHKIYINKHENIRWVDDVIGRFGCYRRFLSKLLSSFQREV